MLTIIGSRDLFWRNGFRLAGSCVGGGWAGARGGVTFVSDIFQEVDEEVRREQLKKLWDKYGHFAIAGCVLIVLAVGAWRGYQWWELKKAAEASTKFDTASTLSADGKHAEAEAAYAQIAQGGVAGYRVLARLREATELAERDPKAAVAAYDALATDSATGQPLQDLATVRAALLLVDTAPLSELTRRLEPIAGPAGPFRHTARELLATAALRAGDAAAVRRWCDMINADPETPADIRARAEMLATLATESGKS
jgi:hypothetical protein